MRRFLSLVSSESGGASKSKSLFSNVVTWSINGVFILKPGVVISLLIWPNRVTIPPSVSLIEKNVLNFDLLDFTRRIKKEFFNDGNLLDVRISEKEMKGFLEKNNVMLKYLADAHVEKIMYLENLGKF